MKKVIAIILVLSMLTFLVGCLDSSGIDKVYFNSINYNNLYDTFDTFWAEGDTVFYDSPGFYTSRTYMNNNGKKTRLLHSNDFSEEYYDASFMPINDFAYFRTRAAEGDKDYIYKYSFENRKYKKILTTDMIDTWIGTENFIGFTKLIDFDEYTEEEIHLYDLYVYDIKSKREILICKEIYEFGIIDDKIRYITPASSDSLSVYEYDVDKCKTEKLGIINASIDYEYPTFNFTKELVTIHQFEYEIIVYSIGGETKKYTLPKTIDQFIAADEFAYALCFDSNEFGGAKGEKQEGIYRIKLSDGTYQRVDYSVESHSRGDGIGFSDVDLHVTSDDEIYIIQGDWFLGSLYKRHAYRMNIKENTKEELFTY